MDALIEGLPDAVALQCLARVPLIFHPHMRSVNRSWRSVLGTEEFFKLRSEIGSSEEWIYVSARVPDKTWQAFNHSCDRWFTIPPLPSSIKNLSNFASVSLGGKLYVMGGDDVDDVDPVTGEHGTLYATDEVWVYDPICRVWHSKAAMSTARTSFACCVLGNFILVAGGCTITRQPIATAEIYYPGNDRWALIADLCQIANGPCIGTVVDGKACVIYRDVPLVQMYDAVHSKWFVVETMSVQRPIGVVEPLPYVILNDIVGTESGEVMYSWPTVYRRQGFGVVSLLEELYLLGGVTLPRSGDLNLEMLSEVWACKLNEDRASCRKVACMTMCKGTIRGCVVVTL